MKRVTGTYRVNITPVTDARRRQKFEKALKQTNWRYGRALKKLAK